MMEKLNQNKGMITLTEEEYEFIDKKSRNYFMYVSITEIRIMQLSIKSGLTNVHLESENSVITDLIQLISESVFKHIRKFELVLQRLDRKITEISIEDWDILKEELTIFPEKFEKLVKKFKVQLQSETNIFDDDLEVLIKNTQRIGRLADEIYSLLYMKEILLRNSK